MSNKTEHNIIEHFLLNSNCIFEVTNWHCKKIRSNSFPNKLDKLIAWYIFIQYISTCLILTIGIVVDIKKRL